MKESDSVQSTLAPQASASDAAPKSRVEKVITIELSADKIIEEGPPELLSKYTKCVVKDVRLATRMNEGVPDAELVELVRLDRRTNIRFPKGMKVGFRNRI